MRLFSQIHNKTQSNALIRALAVFFAVLYVLSAVRGFVPGMCATQSAMAKSNSDNYNASCTLKAGAACCAKNIPTPKTSRGETPLPQNGCVFCTLAKARVEAPERYHFEAPLVQPQLAPFFTPVLPYTADIPSAIQDRAPPTA